MPKRPIQCANAAGDDADEDDGKRLRSMPSEEEDKVINTPLSSSQHSATLAEAANDEKAFICSNPALLTIAQPKSLPLREPFSDKWKEKEDDKIASDEKNGGERKTNAFLKALRDEKHAAKLRQEATADAIPRTGAKMVAPPSPIDAKSSDMRDLDCDESKNDSKILSWVTVLVLFLLSINVVAVTYILSQASFHEVAQTRSFLEVNKLKDELSKCREVTVVMHSAMNETEQRGEFINKASEAQKRTLRNQEQGRAMPLLEEERRRWEEEMQGLEEETKKFRSLFQERLAEFDMQESN